MPTGCIPHLCHCAYCVEQLQARTRVQAAPQQRMLLIFDRCHASAAQPRHVHVLQSFTAPCAHSLLQWHRRGGPSLLLTAASDHHCDDVIVATSRADGESVCTAAQSCHIHRCSAATHRADTPFILQVHFQLQPPFHTHIGAKRGQPADLIPPQRLLILRHCQLESREQ